MKINSKIKENIMIKNNSIQFTNEFYIIEKTVELLVPTKNGESINIRIEALYDCHKGIYQTKSYLKKECKFAFKSSEDETIYEKSIWIEDCNAPWTEKDTADEAIEQAISFIKK